MSDRRTEFLTKLANLLEEYGVEIASNVEGDTHGIDTHELEIAFRGRDGETIGTLDNPPILDASEIRNELLI